MLGSAADQQLLQDVVAVPEPCGGGIQIRPLDAHASHPAVRVAGAAMARKNGLRPMTRGPVGVPSSDQRVGGATSLLTMSRIASTKSSAGTKRDVLSNFALVDADELELPVEARSSG